MKYTNISIFAGACLAATLLAAPAVQAAETSDKIIARMTPGQIAEIMKRAGYAASLDKDGEGDPMIVARGDEGKFGVIFFECEKTGALPDRYCADLEFTTFFELDRKPSLAKLNAWNAGQSFGKTYLDKDGDVALEMPVNLKHGVSESFIVSSLEWWQSINTRFKDHIK